MGKTEIKLEDSWKIALAPEFEKPYFQALVDFLKQEKAKNTVIYPPGSLIFNAFTHTPFDQVKVVLLGQDPYIKPNQAMGLSFSVPKGVAKPPSLENIFKELKTDLGIDPPNHGDLTCWAKQGIFLLNAALTVEAEKSGSHLNKGWGQFTNAVIQTISQQKNNIVFLLWGNFAKEKKSLIDGSKHLILEAAHPSPLAQGAFFGNRHFSKTNQYLEEHGIEPIDWKI